jgi:hypothetical protein
MMLDPNLKILLGYKPETSDDKVMADWKRRASRVCKPCLEIHYCPYGPLVEDFPLLPMTCEEAKEEYEEYKSSLKAGKTCDGEPLEKWRRGLREQFVKKFNPDEYPTVIPKSIERSACSIFGHICPVVFVAEDCTESQKPRRRGRSIPKSTFLRVVRRDNYTCQICGKHLRDEEIELDHIIPISRGGSSEESNFRVTCIKCNRKKSDRLER